MIQPKSKTLLRLHTMHAGEKFLRRDGAVERLARLQAIIAAVAEALRKILAEIPQQRRPPTMARFRISDHGAQLLVRDTLFAFAFFFDEAPLFHHVAHTEEQHALARQTITARAPRFLIIPFNV